MAQEAPADPPPFPVFVDTSLDTHLAVVASPDDSVLDLKGKILMEHASGFPEVGDITILAVKVKRRAALYRLSDSMKVKDAFVGSKGSRFLYVEAVITSDHKALAAKFSSDILAAKDEKQGQSSVFQTMQDANDAVRSIPTANQSPASDIQLGDDRVSKNDQSLDLLSSFDEQKILPEGLSSIHTIREKISVPDNKKKKRHKKPKGKKYSEETERDQVVVAGNGFNELEPHLENNLRNAPLMINENQNEADGLGDEPSKLTDKSYCHIQKCFDEHGAETHSTIEPIPLTTFQKETVGKVAGLGHQPWNSNGVNCVDGDTPETLVTKKIRQKKLKRKKTSEDGAEMQAEIVGSKSAGFKPNLKTVTENDHRCFQSEIGNENDVGMVVDHSKFNEKNDISVQKNATRRKKNHCDGGHEPLAEVDANPPNCEEQYVREKKYIQASAELNSNNPPNQNFANAEDRGSGGPPKKARKSRGRSSLDLDKRQTGKSTPGKVTFNDAHTDDVHPRESFDSAIDHSEKNSDKMVGNGESAQKTNLINSTSHKAALVGSSNIHSSHVYGTASDIMAVSSLDFLSRNACAALLQEHAVSDNSGPSGRENSGKTRNIDDQPFTMNEAENILADRGTEVPLAAKKKYKHLKKIKRSEKLKHGTKNEEVNCTWKNYQSFGSAHDDAIELNPKNGETHDLVFKESEDGNSENSQCKRKSHSSKRKPPGTTTLDCNEVVMSESPFSVKQNNQGHFPEAIGYNIDKSLEVIGEDAEKVPVEKIGASELDPEASSCVDDKGNYCSYKQCSDAKEQEDDKYAGADFTASPLKMPNAEPAEDGAISHPVSPGPTVGKVDFMDILPEQVHQEIVTSGGEGVAKEADTKIDQKPKRKNVKRKKKSHDPSQGFSLDSTPALSQEKKFKLITSEQDEVKYPGANSTAALLEVSNAEPPKDEAIPHSVSPVPEVGKLDLMGIFLPEQVHQRILISEEETVAKETDTKKVQRFKLKNVKGKKKSHIPSQGTSLVSETDLSQENKLQDSSAVTGNAEEDKTVITNDDNAERIQGKSNVSPLDKQIEKTRNVKAVKAPFKKLAAGSHAVQSGPRIESNPEESVNPVASGDSTEDETHDTRRYRVAVRRVLHRGDNYTKDSKKQLRSVHDNIFGDNSSSDSEQAFRRVALNGDHSGTFSSTDSDLDLDDTLQSQAPATIIDYKVNTRRMRGANGVETGLQDSEGSRLNFSAVLRNSSTYKKAKALASKKQHDSENQPVDIVPETQPDDVPS